MSGPFVTAWSTNKEASVRVANGLSVAQGYADTGNLSSSSDSNPRLIGETDNYLIAIGGYGFTDSASGVNQAPLTHLYAGVRRDIPNETTPGAGCRSFIYSNGYTPSPDAFYPVGTNVPGSLQIRPNSWLTLPDDTLAVASGATLYVGKPGLPTRSAALTNAGYTLRQVRGMARLNDGTIALAAQVIRSGDSQPCILVCTPIDVSGSLPASIVLADTEYEFDGVNPWKAAAAALCLAFKGELHKAQVHKFVIPSGVFNWTSLMAYQATPTGAQLLTMQDAMYNENFGDTSPVRAVFEGALAYSETGGVLTYGVTIGAALLDGDTTVSAFDSESAPSSSAFADSDAWQPPAVPLFWQNLVKTREAL